MANYIAYVHEKRNLILFACFCFTDNLTLGFLINFNLKPFDQKLQADPVYTINESSYTLIYK